jgi:hypothetical protein
LTISDDPDAEASQATIELQPPSRVAASPGSADALRIEMREVWWAQTFGLPSVGSALRWARVQFWEEWLRVLLPLGRQSGPAHAARHAPAREIPQALTYRPTPTPPGQPLRLPAEPSTSAGTPPDNPARHWAVRAALGLYGFIQYFWKSLQWLLLAPIVFLLLTLVSVAKLLAIVPFLQTAALKGLASGVEYVSLHWIAPMQVYLLDYTRSSTIRQLFEREVAVFLDDERCDRIVVLAHSMGTVIAYEGLTTLLNTDAAHRRDKAITFVSLGQALRRMWLLTGTDVHRLRVALPPTVRWVNFWARYDPVCAGPLSESSLPRIEQWLDPEMANPHDAICQALSGCENVDIVNADSLFSDHMSYWRNMEQVVGPIARELVMSHPALTQLVEDRQASPDDIVMRRWNVAWRAISALAGAAGAVWLLLLLNSSLSLQIGTKLRTFLQNIDVAGLVGAIFGPIGQGLLQAIQSQSQKNVQAPRPVSTLAGVPYPVADWILTALVALLVLGVARALVERFLAEPSPFTWRAFGRQERGTWTVYALTFLYVALGVVVVVLLVQYNAVAYSSAAQAGSSAALAQVDALNTRVNVSFAIYALGSLITWLVALSDAKYRQRWGWFALMFLALPLALVPSFVSLSSADFSTAFVLPLFAAWMVGVPVAAALTLSVLFHTARHGRWLSFLLMLITLPIAAVGAIAFAPMAPALLYGLLVGPGMLRPGFTRENRVWPLSLATLGLLLLLLDYTLAGSAHDLGQTPAVVGISVLGAVGAIVSIASWIVGMVHIFRRRRWIWLVVVVLVSGLSWLFSWFFLYSTVQQTCADQSCTLTQPGFAGLISQLAFGLAPGLIAGILTYGLVAAPTKPRPHPAAPQPAMMPPVPVGLPRM